MFAISKCAEKLMVYQFAGELRKPTVKIAATDRWSAIVHYAKLTSRTGNKPPLPRAEIEFSPEEHIGKVEFAEVDEETLVNLPPYVQEKRRPKDRSRYGNAYPDMYPLLDHFGRGSINPEWVIDRKTGKVEPSGEFLSIPRYFLDLSGKPSLEEVQAAGGKVNNGGGLDVQAEMLNDTYPWLNLQDGEDLRMRLLSEVDRYEREYL